MSAQRNENDQYRKVSDVQEFFMRNGRQAPMTERVKWIREQGDNLGTFSGDLGNQLNREILDRLTDGLNEQEKGQVLNTVIDTAWQKAKTSNPATFLRSNSIFKLAAEYQLREKLEQDPSIIDRYLEDPITFCEQDNIEPNLLKIFKEVVNTAEPDKKAAAVANMNFIRSGTILNYCQEQSKNPNLTDQQRAQWKQKHMQAMKESNFRLTDCNIVMTGNYTSKFHSMTTRRQHVITNSEIERYSAMLDNKLNSIDPDKYPKGSINMDKQYRERITDFKGKRNEWAQQKEQERLDARSGFEKFVDGIKSMWNKVFGNDDQEVTIKITSDNKPVNDPEIRQESQEEVGHELEEMGYKQEVEETMGRDIDPENVVDIKMNQEMGNDIDPNHVVDIKVESRSKNIREQVEQAQDIIGKNPDIARPETPGQTKGQDIHSELDNAKQARPETPKGPETPGKD